MRPAYDLGARGLGELAQESHPAELAPHTIEFDYTSWHRPSPGTVTTMKPNDQLLTQRFIDHAPGAGDRRRYFDSCPHELVCCESGCDGKADAIIRVRGSGSAGEFEVAVCNGHEVTYDGLEWVEAWRVVLRRHETGWQSGAGQVTAATRLVRPPPARQPQPTASGTASC